MLSFLHSPTLTSIHDNWKNHSLACYITINVWLSKFLWLITDGLWDKFSSVQSSEVFIYHLYKSVSTSPFFFFFSSPLHAHTQTFLFFYLQTEGRKLMLQIKAMKGSFGFCLCFFAWQTCTQFLSKEDTYFSTLTENPTNYLVTLFCSLIVPFAYSSQHVSHFFL